MTQTFLIATLVEHESMHNFLIVSIVIQYALMFYFNVFRNSRFEKYSRYVINQKIIATGFIKSTPRVISLKSELLLVLSSIPEITPHFRSKNVTIVLRRSSRPHQFKIYQS